MELEDEGKTARMFHLDSTELEGQAEELKAAPDLTSISAKPRRSHWNRVVSHFF
jgi:hypothetical protein